MDFLWQAINNSQIEQSELDDWISVGFNQHNNIELIEVRSFMTDMLLFQSNAQRHDKNAISLRQVTDSNGNPDKQLSIVIGSSIIDEKALFGHKSIIGTSRGAIHDQNKLSAILFNKNQK